MTNRAGSYKKKTVTMKKLHQKNLRPTRNLLINGPMRNHPVMNGPMGSLLTIGTARAMLTGRLKESIVHEV